MNINLSNTKNIRNTTDRQSRNFAYKNRYIKQIFRFSILERSSAMKKRVVIITSIVIIGAITALGIYSRKKAEIKQVKTAVVKKGDIQSYLSTTATIKSKNSKEYYGAQLKIQKINVAVGDKVKSGQSLISYDITDLSTQLRQAELQYNNAVLQKQELENQVGNINSKISDLDEKIREAENSKDPSVRALLPSLKQQRDAIQPISNVKVEEANNAIELAKTSLDAANSRLSSVKNGVVSQIDGVVTALNAVEGTTANPAQPLAVVQDLSNLKAQVSLGKYDADKVKIGQEAVIKAPGKSYKGKVAFINPAPTKTQSPTGGETTLLADIDILNVSENLKVDFDTDIDILTAFKANVLRVPAEAIKTDKYGKSYIFINNNGIAQKKDIKTGIKSDVEAEVTEGLAQGDKVILNPSSNITDGTKVREVA